MSADHLRVRYRNGALGILDVSFAVAAGHVVALFGANGAGKTSTVRGVGGFLRTEGARVTRGTVTFAGDDVTNLEPHRIAKRGLFLVPERDKVFPGLSVFENLSTVGRLPRGMRRMELFDRVFSLFPTLAERRHALAGTLSGGERQMLALGRGIVSDSRVLIVDEMTLGLHHGLHTPLFEAIRLFAAQGMAVVLVDETVASALDVADYCYIIANGQVVQQGPSDAFRGKELAVAEYMGTA